MRPWGSLQGRLLVLVLGAVTAIWLAAAALTALGARHELDELLDGHLAQAAALLVVQQTRAEGDDEHDHAVDAPSLHRYAPGVVFQVWHEGRLSMRSSNAPREPMWKDEGFRPGLRTVWIGGRAWRLFLAHGAEQDVQVVVGEQLRSRWAILGAVLRAWVVTLPLALLLLGVAVWLAVRGGLRPLRALRERLQQRSPQDLQPLSMPQAPAELAAPLEALNGLFGRIEALLQSERRFTDAAAHELRTPLAAIRAQAQVALAEADAPARAHALRATLDGCDRAARLVDQLLMLARLDAQAPPGPQASFDLGALVRGVAAELAPVALVRRQQLELEAEAACPVTGHEALLAALVRNLVDNALRYSPEHASVRVRVSAPAGRPRLQVDDSGPGLAEADRQRLGERFFRVAGTDAPGSGLGWSIVRRVAAAHGLELAVHASAELGGLGVTVDWPRARP